MNKRRRKHEKIISTALALIAVLSLMTFTSCSFDVTNSDAPSYVTGDAIDGGTGSGDNADAEIKTEDLIIPLSGLTSNAQFFSIIVDDTYMEIIAFKIGSSYRTAFNTCRVCYGSRTAYYKQSGNYLVCQNCGNRFELSGVGLYIDSYTCSPYPILDGDRTIDDDNIIITYDFLARMKTIFKTWKVT